MVLGILVAFISAALAIKWLVGYLTRHGLALFAWYRFALAILVLIFLVR
jgi:undecaprenyl-diphosphatase